MARKSCTSSPDMFSSFLASPPKNEVLDRLLGLVDWGRLRARLDGLYKWGGAGREPVDPVMLFKLLLLERLYQLSDGQAVWMAKDSLSFRSFLGLGADGVVPDDTTLVVFRRRLVEAGLLDELFADVTVQLEDQGVGVREGYIKIVDATLVEAAVRPPRRPQPPAEPDETALAPDERRVLDPDADFTVKNARVHYGYKLHIGVDRETGLVTHHVVTAASVHDSQVLADLVDGRESEVLTDKAYDSRALRLRLAAWSVLASIMKQARPGRALSAWQRARNRSIGRVRNYVEGVFASLKRYLGCKRASYRGLDRVMLQMTFGILAWNLTRAVALQQEKCA